MLLAVAGGLVWNAFVADARGAGGPEGTVPGGEVALFRLPSESGREMLLLPAGPDAIGEPRLSARLFPGEQPPRRLASLLLANVSSPEPWVVDLDAVPLACRAPGGAWEPLRPLDEGAPEASALAPQDRLRLRSLGSGSSRVTVEPSSLRHVLLALPPEREVAALSDVRWGDRPLFPDRLALERLRRFRENPGAAATGR